MKKCICITEQLLELHRGQGMDIYWRDAHKCPTEEEYKTMVIRSKYLLIILAYFSAHWTKLFILYFTLCKRLFSWKIQCIFVLARGYLWNYHLQPILMFLYSRNWWTLRSCSETNASFQWLQIVRILYDRFNSF